MTQEQYYLNKLGKECFKLPERPKPSNLNNNNYLHDCLKLRPGFSQTLDRKNCLSEFSMEEEKAEARSNLGITPLLEELSRLLDTRVLTLERSVVEQTPSEEEETLKNRVLSTYGLLNLLKNYYTKAIIDEELTRLRLIIADQNVVDEVLDSDSTNPVLNRIVKDALDGIYDVLNLKILLLIADTQEYIDSLKLVQSDWNELNSDAESFIKNKPTKLSLFINDSGYITSYLLLNSLEEILEDFVSDEFVTKNELGDYITREELFDILNPFKITISVNPNFLERTGEVKNITITVSHKKGNTNVTPDTCKISYGGNTYNFTGSYIAQVSLSTSFTVTCTYKSETSSASGSVNFVYPSYFGFIETSDFNSVDTSQLAKDVRASILCTKTLNNTVAGSYLWIVTPYSLNTVATDPGYTYKVAMVLSGSKDGLNYYRSNSAIDISNLTYYIK